MGDAALERVGRQLAEIRVVVLRGGERREEQGGEACEEHAGRVCVYETDG